MVGIIASVNIDKNSAVLVDKNKKQYPFCLDDCIGFESFPEIGEQVEFDLNGEEVFFVEALQSEKSTPTNTTKTKKTSNIELHLSIPLDVDVTECLNNYFEEIISTVYEYEAEFEAGESLDFLLMRRFLNTAYNNLRDMDSTFMDEYLVELRGDLKVLESVYQKFHKRNSIPQVAYETIFLEQQITYQKYKSRIDSNISELHTSKSTMKSLELQIKDVEREIRTSTITKYIESKQIDLKRYNRYYVDTIHRSANLKDENIQLKESLAKFETKYIDEFVSVYSKEANKYDKFLREQLDGYAYEFDKKMWESAETSSSIRSFFKRANIDDDFSSKTFLKYFIKGLDETKFSKEHKRLYSLLEYLEGRAKVRVLIVGESQKELDVMKHIIRSFDKEYNVEVSDKPRSTYYRKDLARLDIIFADLSMQNPSVYEYIDMLEKRFTQSNSHAILCITSSSFTKESLIKLKEKQMNNLLATNLTQDELQLKLKEIIDFIDG